MPRTSALALLPFSDAHWSAAGRDWLSPAGQPLKHCFADLCLAFRRFAPRHPCDFQASPAERMEFVMTSLIGCVIGVQAKDGSVYEGILHAGWWQDGVTGLCLKQCKKMVGPNDMAQRVIDEKVIAKDDFVRLVTKVDVDLYNDEITEAARRKGGGVEADSEIEVAGGRAAFGEERDLVMASAWVGDGEDLGLNDMAASSSGKSQRGWDQFAVNRQLGVTSTYSDELYTTSLKDKKFSAAQVAAAERLAREIEKGVTTNAHILEERGLKELDDNDDMDEEEKYSMVGGARTGASGKPSVPAGKPPAAASTAAPAAPVAAGPAPTPDDKPAAEKSAPAPTPTAAPAAATAPAPAGSTPSRFAGTSKLKATAKEFVPMFAQASTPPAAPPASAPQVPPQQMQQGAYAMGSPSGQMMPNGQMVPMAQMGYPGMAQGMMPQHGAYVQAGMQMHPGMMSPGQQQPTMQMHQQHAAHMMAAQQQQQQYAQQQQQQGGMRPQAPPMMHQHSGGMMQPMMMGGPGMPMGAGGQMMPVNPAAQQMMMQRASHGQMQSAGPRSMGPQGPMGGQPYGMQQMRGGYPTGPPHGYAPSPPQKGDGH